MSISASSGYKSALDGALDEHWIVEIANSAGTYIRLSTKDFGSGTSQYHGFITNKPTIRESINLVESSSTTSNVTLSCLNGTIANISGQTPTLAEEIYGGDRYYINRDVTIKSRLDSTEDLVIYTGRLKSVTFRDNDIVDLVIAAKTPIDFLKIPQHTSKAGNFYPIAYGAGVPETSTVSTPTFVTDARVFPVQVDTLNNDVYNCLSHKPVTDGRLHYPIKDAFDNEFPMFVPLDDIQNASYDDYEGETNNTNKNVIFTDLDLERSYLFHPQTVTDAASVTGLTVANAGNAYDSNTTSAATLTFSSDADISPGGTYILEDLPREEHSISELNFSFTHQTTNFSDTNGELIITLRVLAEWNGVSSHAQIQKTANAASAPTTFNLLDTSVFSSSLKSIPDKIKLFISFGSDPQDAGNGTANTATVSVKDMNIEYRTKIDQPTASDGTAEKLSKSSAVNNIKKLYTGADGFTQSWSTSTAITNIAQMHRDLLYRYAGITAVPENYSALNTARASWTIFYYTNEQITLKELLELTQKEGGFVFRFKANDASPQYIFLSNSETADHTISKNDIKGTKVSVTPFDNLITKRVVKYQRIPINDELLKEKTCTDTSTNPRTNYNVQSDENVSSDDLEILNGGVGDTNMGGVRNNGFANYYNALHGVPKLIIETEIVNPGSSGGSNYFYLMEVGDIVAFNHSNQIAAPFGASYNGKKFIVTSLVRSIGTLKVIVKEI